MSACVALLAYLIHIVLHDVKGVSHAQPHPPTAHQTQQQTEYTHRLQLQYKPTPYGSNTVTPVVAC
jgi:hypothetical protein